MTKQNLLVVDADPRSLRVLEVSLRNAGYNVAGCPSVGKALEILHANKPDLILSDTTFSDLNGFEFVEQLRQNRDWSDIPFMFLSSDGSIESKIRGLELGVQDYLTKPIYIREVVARVGIELARQARAGLAQKSLDSRTRFSGSLSEMSVVDLLQTIDVSRKSGVLTLVAADGQEGMISFDSGAVINATVEDLRGEEAIYRHLLWREGTFDLEFRRVSLSERTVHRTTQALLMEGMRRLDEWSRLSELLPSFDTVLELDPEMLRERLREMPDEQNEMVRLIDGQRSIGRLLLAHGGDHVDALRKIVDLYFEGMVREAGTIKDSIPILTEVTVKSSPPPVKEGVNTIPGPAGRRAVDVSVPGAPVLPEISDASSAVTAREMRAAPRSPSASVPAPAGGSASAPVSVPASASAPAPATAPSDQLTTPVSLPTPDAQPINASGEPILTPSGPPTVLAPQTGSPPEQDRVWEPAPPPATPRPRQQTPTGFQTAQPESSMYAGGTILNWAGRVRTIDASEDASSRETVEVGTWDHTLDELRSDPEVADAIEAIDSDPPPAPFVRSRPPSDRAIDQAIERGEAQRSNAPVVREEPPVADRPRTDYEHVFEKEEGGSLKAPLPVRGPIAMQQRDSGPLMLPWALVLVLIVAGTGLFAYLLGSGPGSESEKPIVTEAERGPSTETATRAPTDTATRADTDIATGAAAETATATETAAAAGGETTAAETATAAPSEPAPGSTPVENPEAVYAATGVADTYEAQLALARRLKRGSRAVAAYRRAIALNPEASPALAELARLMLARQNTREASELAERATAIDPSNALAWVTLGAARQMRGDRQGARQAYRNCAKLGKGRYVRECRAMLR